MEADELSEARSHRSLVLGAATNWLAFAAAMAVSFFLAPYLIRSLGDARYGIFRVVESILAYFTLFDLGIAACLVRYVARHHSTQERETLNRLISASLAIFCAASAVMLLLGLALVPVIAPALEQRANSPGDVAAFMLLMLANLAITLPLSVFPTILDGLQRFGIKSLVRLGVLAVRVAGIVLVMEHSPSLLSLAIVFTTTNLLEHAIMIGLAYRYLPGLEIRRRFVDRETLRQVKGSSVDAFLAMLAGRITVQTGAIVVGGFLNAAAAAHYAIAASLVELAKNLLRTITTTLTPAVSEREAKGDHDGVRAMFLNATRCVLYLVIPIHLGMIFFGRPFLERWIGKPEYAEWCYPALLILSATLTISVAQSVASRILYGLGRLRLFARLALVEAGLNLVLSLALVGPWGLEGVAFAVAIPNILFCVTVIVMVCRMLGVPAGTYLVHGWLKPCVACMVPTAIWLWHGPVDASWFGIAAGIALGLVPYAILVMAVEIGPRIEAGSLARIGLFARRVRSAPSAPRA